MPDHESERPLDPEHDRAHSQLSKTELRVRALESVLTQKRYVDPAALDLLIETYEKRIGPHNGARVVAKAWADEEYKRAHDCCREHAATPQHGRLHAVLLLSVGRARASAGVV